VWVAILVGLSDGIPRYAYAIRGQDLIRLL